MEVQMPDIPAKKDTWDRITALATILIPAAIALAGHFIAQGLKQAEITSEENRAAQSRLIAEANTKIAQANLINSMMKSLTSANSQERKLAVEAVLIALPEQGQVLVRIIAQSDEDKTVQAVARNTLEYRGNTLIRELFSADTPTRKSAAQALIQGWRDDPNIVLEMVKYAADNKDNANGVYNTAAVLSEFSPVALQGHKQEIINFAETAKKIGPKTENKALDLTKLLQK